MLNAWKLANVVFMYKGKGSKVQVENDRPISLTNVFCKLMKFLVCKKVVDFLNSNNLIFPSQWSFRSSRSTMSQLLLAKSKLVDVFNQRACTDAVYTDLRKETLRCEKLVQ